MTTGGVGMTTGWDRLVWDALEKPGGDEGERDSILDVPGDRLSSSYRRKPVSIPWIPAFTGMTRGSAGMTMGGAGMTTGGAGMTTGGAGMTGGIGLHGIP